MTLAQRIEAEIDFRIVERTPTLAIVELYATDATSGKATTLTKKYAIKSDGTAIERNA